MTICLICKWCLSILKDTMTVFACFRPFIKHFKIPAKPFPKHAEVCFHFQFKHCLPFISICYDNNAETWNMLGISNLHLLLKKWTFLLLQKINWIMSPKYGFMDFHFCCSGRTQTMHSRLDPKWLKLTPISEWKPTMVCNNIIQYNNMSSNVHMSLGRGAVVKQVFWTNDGFRGTNYIYLGLPDTFMTPRSAPPVVQLFCPLRKVSQLSIFNNQGPAEDCLFRQMLGPSTAGH